MNKVIPLKPKLKKRIPWEIAEIYKKRDIMHKVAQVNIDNFFKTQKSLENSYDLEQKNYINLKINEIKQLLQIRNMHWLGKK